MAPGLTRAFVRRGDPDMRGPSRVVQDCNRRPGRSRESSEPRDDRGMPTPRTSRPPEGFTCHGPSARRSQQGDDDVLEEVERWLRRPLLVCRRPPARPPARRQARSGRGRDRQRRAARARRGGHGRRDRRGDPARADERARTRWSTSWSSSTPAPPTARREVAAAAGRPGRAPRRRAAPPARPARQGRGAVALAARHQRGHRLLRRRRPARLLRRLRLRHRRPAADRPAACSSSRRMYDRPLRDERRRRPGAAGSPSWWPARC